MSLPGLDTASPGLLSLPGLDTASPGSLRFVFVAAVTVASFLHWALRSVRRDAHAQYVRRQLRALDRLNRETDVQAARFAAEYLRHDGVFVLRLIAKNAGELIATEVRNLTQRFEHRHVAKLVIGSVGPSPPRTSQL